MWCKLRDIIFLYTPLRPTTIHYIKMEEHHHYTAYQIKYMTCGSCSLCLLLKFTSPSLMGYVLMKQANIMKKGRMRKYLYTQVCDRMKRTKDFTMYEVSWESSEQASQRSYGTAPGHPSTSWLHPHWHCSHHWALLWKSFLLPLSTSMPLICVTWILWNA